MKVIIDRFEGDYAVVEMEDRKLVDMPKELVPKGAKEGDILVIKIDKGDNRKKRIEKMCENLWE